MTSVPTRTNSRIACLTRVLHPQRLIAATMPYRAAMAALSVFAIGMPAHLSAQPALGSPIQARPATQTTAGNGIQTPLAAPTAVSSGAQAPLAVVAAPTTGRAGRNDEVLLNFVNADIQAVIRAVSDIIGRNILIDSRVNGTVNIVAPRPVPRSMVLEVLLSALRAQGFTATGLDTDLIRVVPEAEAKFHGDGPSLGKADDKIVTEVFRLEFEQAAQAVNAVRPLITPNNVVSAFAATNTLVVTDYAENIERIRRLIAKIDQPNPGDLITIPLHHASALDVVQTISRLMPEVRATYASTNQAGGALQGQVPTNPSAPNGNGTSERILITAEPRSNSVVMRVFNSGLVARIRELIQSIDQPSATPGNLHVVYLRNAEALKMANMLRGVLMAHGTTSPLTGQPGVPPGAAGFNQSAGGNGLPGNAAQGPGLMTGPSASFGQSSTNGSQSGFTAGGATIQAYPDLNSLVIIAPDYLYNQLRSVIDQLDSRRAQIYIEALIVEVTSDKGAELGIQWQQFSGGSTNGTAVIGGTNFTNGSGANILGVAQNPAAVGAGLALGVMNGTVNVPGVGSILNLSVLARALQSDSKTNILSTPSLLTLDNEEAKIVVGQNIPIVTGSYTTASSGSSNPFTTVDRRDVGLQLRVRPQVTQGGGVKLQIYEEVSTVVASSVNTSQGIITNKRSIESTVMVDSSQIIVIGGLIQDAVTESNQSIPLLGSIPFLGSLFRYDQRERQKTNLMIFLRPVVLLDGQSVNSISTDRYDFIRGVQGSQEPRHSFALPDMPAPQMNGNLSQPSVVRPVTANEAQSRAADSAAPQGAPADQTVVPAETATFNVGSRPAFPASPAAPAAPIPFR